MNSSGNCKGVIGKISLRTTDLQHILDIVIKLEAYIFEPNYHYTIKYVWGVTYRAGGAGAAGAARAAPLLNSNIISSMGWGSAEPPKILLPYLQWPPHFSWASDAPGHI